MAIVIPVSYLALFYAVGTASGLLLALLVGSRLHLEELTKTHCKTPEYWPSVSATTGDFIHGRTIWRVTLLFMVTPRFVVSTFIYSLYSSVVTGPAGAGMSQLMYISDIIRIISAVGWSMLASSDDLTIHEMCFGIYMASGFFLQLMQVFLAHRAQSSVPNGAASFKWKRICLIGQSVSALLVVYFFLDHRATCLPGAYSRSTMCEWCFSLFNILFDATQYLDLGQETITFGTHTPPGDSKQNQKSVPSALLWLADIFFAHSHWGLLVQLYQAVYFIPMVAMKFTPEVVFALAPAATLLLYYRPFSTLAAGTIRGVPSYIVFYALSLIGYFAMNITLNAGGRIIVYGIGVIFACWAFASRFLLTTHPIDTTTADITRVSYAFPFGLVVSMCFRILYVGLDPLHVSAVFNAVGGIYLGLICTGIIYYQHLYVSVQPHHGKNKDEGDLRIIAGTDGTDVVPTASVSQPARRSVYPAYAYGIAFGALCSLSSVIVTNGGVLPRYVAMNPYPAAIAVILVFTLGIALSTKFTNVYVIVGLMVKGFAVFYFSATQSNRMFEKKTSKYYPTWYETPLDKVNIEDWYAEELSGSPMIAFLGALVMVFTTGLLWPLVMENSIIFQRLHRINCRNARPMIIGTFEFTYFTSQFFPLIMHVYVVCFPFVPGGFFFRDRIYIPYLVCFALLVLAIPRCIRYNAQHSGSHASRYRIGTVSTTVYLVLALLLMSCIIGRAVFAPRSISQPEPLGAPSPAQIDLLENKALVYLRDPNSTRWLRDDLEASIAPVSTMIWTLHFAQDNFGVDSTYRLIDMVRAEKPGIIGFLESDMSRIMNGNRDIVEHVSYSLGMDYTDYGPTTFDGTFGCALVSRFPITYVRRYVTPSPVGELACLIHAKLNVGGVSVNVYVGHWGNTEHAPDRRLQSQFLGKLVSENPGPSVFLGYLTTRVTGENYKFMVNPEATDDVLFRDAGYTMYKERPWKRIDPEGAALSPKEIDDQFKPLPSNVPKRKFRYDKSGLELESHPRYEWLDRYCQYILYKSGEKSTNEQSPLSWNLLHWKRVMDIHELSDTEIQSAKFVFNTKNMWHKGN